jgi:hypothetical protein
MTVATAPYWSEVSGEARIGRRGLLILSAGAAAALLTVGNPLSSTLVIAPVSPQEFVRTLGKARWSWAVELAVLQRLDNDRRGALDLLWAALEVDIDPSQRRHRRPALRLYDLYAAATNADGRAALARLAAASSDPALISRASLWSDPTRSRRSPVWRTVGPDRRPIGIALSDA